MIEGTLKVHWDNSDNPADTRMYRVTFMPYQRFDSCCQQHKEILGEESLLDYLIEIQGASTPLEQRADRAEDLLRSVHYAGHLSLENTQLTEEQFQVFNPA